MKPTFWQRVACAFGFHPDNPRTLIHEEAWYVVHAVLHTNDGETWNGDSHWTERCPRCGRWHPAPIRDTCYPMHSTEAKALRDNATALGWKW